MSIGGYVQILDHYYTGHAYRRIGGIFGGRIEGDMDGDCDCDIIDIQLVAAHWNTQVGDPNYVPFYDSEHDCDIDILDIQRVAAHWGESCPW